MAPQHLKEVEHNNDEIYRSVGDATNYPTNSEGVTTNCAVGNNRDRRAATNIIPKAGAVARCSSPTLDRGNKAAESDKTAKPPTRNVGNESNSYPGSAFSWTSTKNCDFDSARRTENSYYHRHHRHRPSGEPPPDHPGAR
jgi:hypothetical protein